MRLIDADEAILQIERREKHLVGDLFISVDAMKEFIKNRPTIEPVKHGKWEVGCAGKIRICSNCKESFDDTCNFIERDWQYCPNCGARMDK